ncbi:MAG: Holliday junction branch migration protein RuvA [Coriobacteriales bacterium]|jgi:Holliday junction DNA helicase RuvA|nr:Holliday junction branch migration protein RuvA [Coriobacteriales bacterium]
MIASLRGELVARDATGIVIEVGGVGYRVGMSTLSLASLGELGTELMVFTTLIARDEGMALYGFLSTREQQLFEKLITISGVGPKVALSALSSFAPNVLQQLIHDEDAMRIATIPGIGKKTAQRIILELRGALSTVEESATTTQVSSRGTAQAVEALLGMGFTSAEADLALQEYEGPDVDVSALIRHALKRLGG